MYSLCEGLYTHCEVLKVLKVPEVLQVLVPRVPTVLVPRVPPVLVPVCRRCW